MALKTFLKPHRNSTDYWRFLDTAACVFMNVHLAKINDPPTLLLVYLSHPPPEYTGRAHCPPLCSISFLLPCQSFLELHVVRCVTLAQGEAGVQVGLHELGLLHRGQDLFPSTDLSFMSVEHEHARATHHPTQHTQTYTRTHTAAI